LAIVHKSHIEETPSIDRPIGYQTSIRNSNVKHLRPQVLVQLQNWEVTANGLLVNAILKTNARTRLTLIFGRHRNGCVKKVHFVTPLCLPRSGRFCCQPLLPGFLFVRFGPPPLSTVFLSDRFCFPPPLTCFRSASSSPPHGASLGHCESRGCLLDHRESPSVGFSPAAACFVGLVRRVTSAGRRSHLSAAAVPPQGRRQPPLRRGGGNGHLRSATAPPTNPASDNARTAAESLPVGIQHKLGDATAAQSSRAMVNECLVNRRCSGTCG
jgi:hypothetical protein